MSIPIDDITPRVQYAAVLGQTAFTVPFPYYENTDLVVYKRATGSSADDAVDLLVLITDYTVGAGAGTATGGSITLVAGATAGDVVTILRNMPQSRTQGRANLYLSGGDLTAVALNTDFSRDVMMVQQNELTANSLSPKYDNNATIGGGDQLMDVLPAGYSWRKNAAGTKIESFLAAAAVIPVVNSTVTVDITQNAHGLAVGEVVQLDNAGNYVVAQNDDVDDKTVVGYVSAVADANTFTLLMGGIITTGLAALTVGSVYYLSTLGNITAVKPTGRNDYIAPLLVAASATTGVWINQLAEPVVKDQITVAQAAHGLLANDIIYVNAAGNYVKSQANALATAEVAGIVIDGAPTNSFTYQYDGVVTGLVGLTVGDIYYLQINAAGLMSNIRPTDNGLIVKPVLQAITTTSGIWLNYLGVIL